MKGYKLPTILAFIFLAVTIASLAQQPTKPTIIYSENTPHGMPPVETTARKSDLLSVKQHFKSSNENLRCNFDEIADLKLQAVYVKGENANNVFMVFDQSTEAKVADAELVIEIIPLGGLMFDPVKNKDFIRTINGYTAYVNEAAPCFWEDYQTRFGKTSIVIDVAVDGYNYWIRAAPTFTLEEALEIANAITS